MKCTSFHFLSRESEHGADVEFTAILTFSIFEFTYLNEVFGRRDECDAHTMFFLQFSMAKSVVLSACRLSNHERWSSYGLFIPLNSRPRMPNKAHPFMADSRSHYVYHSPPAFLRLSSARERSSLADWIYVRRTDEWNLALTESMYNSPITCERIGRCRPLPSCLNTQL